MTMPANVDEKVAIATKGIEDRFKQILDAVPDLVLIKERDSRLVWANAAFRKLYGIPKEYFEQRPEAQNYNIEVTQQYVKDDAIVFNEGRVLVIPSEPLTRLDGEVLRVHTTKSPIYGDSGTVEMLVAVCHDLTERHKLEAQLRLADRMASVGTLAAGIAHEINTPVQFLSDSIHFLREAMEDVLSLVSIACDMQSLILNDAPSAEAQALAVAFHDQAKVADLPYLLEHAPRAFDRCIEGLERIGTIVGSMKAFAYPSQDDMAPADLNKAIRNTLTIAQSEYRLVAELATDLRNLPPVVCFVTEINQAILNILVNAAHAVAQVVASDSLKGSIKVTSYRDGGDAVITISDTGPGIPPEIASRVFEMFFTTKEVGKGTGQGLALAWSVVTERHGGKLMFESTLGVGTTFIIRLPIAGKNAAVSA